MEHVNNQGFFVLNITKIITKKKKKRENDKAEKQIKSWTKITGKQPANSMNTE